MEVEEDELIIPDEKENVEGITMDFNSSRQFIRTKSYFSKGRKKPKQNKKYIPKHDIF
jgi:hypothetical protein